jgi:hypothetical protein
LGKFKRRTATFIIRLWVEYLDQEPPIYRGEIESVTSSQKIAFGDLSALIAFLQEQASPISQTSEVE